MLLINNKKVNVEEFISRIESITGKKVEISELKSNLEFSYNPTRKGYDYALLRDKGIKVSNTLKSDDILAVFKIWDNNEGESVEFRFANRLPYENSKVPGNIIYDPKAIEISGSGFAFEQKDFEKAVFLYIHPLCFDSPLHETGRPYKYSHINPKAESRLKKEKMSKTQKAFTHASAIDDSELKIIALGLNIDLIPNADKDDIRTAILEFAMKSPDVYLEKTSTETVKFEGMILEALETRFIIKKEVGGIPTWEIGSGSRKGQQILVITNSDADHNLELMNHLKKNIAQYYPILSSFNNDVTADLTAEQYLSKVKNGGSKSDILPYEESHDITIDGVVDYKTAQLFLINNHPSGGQASAANTKKFLEEVLAGNITSENINEEVLKYLKKS